MDIGWAENLSGFSNGHLVGWLFQPTKCPFRYNLILCNLTYQITTSTQNFTNHFYFTLYWLLDLSNLVQ